MSFTFFPHPAGDDRSQVIAATADLARNACGSAATVLGQRAWSTLATFLEQRLSEIEPATRSSDSVAVANEHPRGVSRPVLEEGGRIEDTTALIVRQWLGYVIELSERLERDRDEISHRWFSDRAIGLAEEIDAALGDRHDNGRCVSAITFECGLKLVYKPRSVGLLKAWGRLFRVVGMLAGDDSIVTADVIDRGSYGWAGWVSSVPCANTLETRRFAWRAGLLLAIADVLGASDLHRDNLIGHRDCPVLIDAETLLRVAWLRSPSVDSVRARAFDVLATEGVLRTGLLPRWQWVDGRPVDPSPMGRWIADSYVHTLLEGLETCYVVLASLPGRRAIHEFLTSVEGLPARVVVRPTLWYQKAIKSLPISGVRGTCPDDPDGLREVCDGAGNRTKNSRGPAALAPVELNALLRRDIPRIEVREGQQILGLPTIDHTASLSAHVRRRLAELHPNERARQAALAKASFALRCATDRTCEDGQAVTESLEVVPKQGSSSDGEPRTLRTAEAATANTKAARGLDAETIAIVGDRAFDDAPTDVFLVSAAERIGETILGGAIDSEKGLLWITCRPTRSREAWQFVPADFGLYDGNAGIAAFFAALWRCTGSSCWHAAALEAARPVLDAVTYKGAGPRFVERFGIGGAEGLGGVLFGLALTQRISGESFPWDEILTVARGACGLNVPDELLYGRSGFVLGALSAWKVSGLDAFRELAFHEAHRLLRTRRGFPGVLLPHRAVLRPDPHGIAHGHGGVVIAVAAAAAAGDSRCLEALDDFIECIYEFEHETSDTNPGPEPSSDEALSWCCGAAGEVAVLTECAPVVSGRLEPLIQQRRARLTEALVMRDMMERAALCCGLAGRIDALVSLLAGCDSESRGVESRAENHDSARVNVRTAIRTHVTLLLSDVDSGRLPGLLSRRALWPYSAGLYRGLSGIGYVLLRSVISNAIPSPTAWVLPGPSASSGERCDRVGAIRAASTKSGANEGATLPASGPRTSVAFARSFS